MEHLDMVYLFGFSPRYGNEATRLLPIVKNNLKNGKSVGIVLIHDGVIGASSRGLITDTMEELGNFKLYVMKPDLKARGIPLEYTHESIRPIEYSELVELLDNSQKVISWM